MIIVPMGEDYRFHPVEVPVHALAIVKERRALAGIEQEVTPLPLHKRREAILPESPGNGADRIVTENGDAVAHTSSPVGTQSAAPFVI